jgi:hypothetical protein
LHALDDASPENCARLVADAETLISDSKALLAQLYEDLPWRSRIQPPNLARREDSLMLVSG